MSVHSTDRIENTGKTKLERLSERAENRKETVFNNVGHLIDRELLKQMYYRIDGNKAIGIDGISKEIYGRQLDENIDNLIQSIRRGTYRPKPARLVEIPKEDGSTRPLAISCFADKLVQMSVSEILTRIYEPLFLPCSFGYRPGRSCHDALCALMELAYPCWNGAIVEIDIQKYFNSIPHAELKEILKKKISDERFLRLIDKLATTPICDKGKVVANTIGCPQGSTISPILANIYLHEVIDCWFEEIKGKHLKGSAHEVRYADDMVFVFEKVDDARRFFKVLPKRLKKYGLMMHQEKSRLIRSGQNVAAREHKIGNRLPTYKFLGFTVYWGKARNGQWWRMKVTSRRDRFTAKLKGLKEYLRTQMNTSDTMNVLKTVVRVIVGWVNYNAVSDNERRVNQFLRISRRIILRWINRRGRKKPMTWEKLMRLLKAINFPDQWETKSLFANARGNGV